MTHPTAKEITETFRELATAVTTSRTLTKSQREEALKRIYERQSVELRKAKRRALLK